ncbi:MAG: dTDP-glucose 4,6-dehydratase [Candidatus Delongbacteria bacterium]
MRLLVTGGAGFIGCNFIRWLRERHPEHAVVNLDALTYAGCRASLAELEGREGYEFVHGDIQDAGLVNSLLERVDGLINFAAESHVDRSIDDPDVFLRTNILGLRVLLDGLRAQLARGRRLRLLQVSTDEVYGDLGEGGGRFTEETPLAPSSPYSASKAAGDLLLQAWRRTFGVEAVLTRCSNNYGPYQFPEKLIPLMIWKAARDEELPVYGQGLNVRDWLYVEDHAEALWTVFTRATDGAVYNVGGDNEWRNIEIVKLLLRKLGKPERLIRFVGDRPGHDLRYAIDAGRLERELGWRPRVNFEDGLARTLDWYSNNTAWTDALRRRVAAS